MIGRRLIVALVAAGLTTGAYAQTQPPIREKWPVASKPIKIHYNMPADCDPYLARAADTWNAANARFQMTGATQNYGSEYLTSDTQYDYINVVDADVHSVRGSTVPLYTQTIVGPGSPYYPIQDANIYVESSRLYYGYETPSQGMFSCAAAPPAGTIDYQSAILHEFGHVLGFGERTDSAICVMRASLPQGTTRRVLCSDEATKLRSVYGTR